MKDDLASKVLDWLIYTREKELGSQGRFHNTRFWKCKKCQDAKKELRQLKWIRDDNRQYWKNNINKEQYTHENQ